MRKLKRNHKAYASWASSKYNNNLKFMIIVMKMMKMMKWWKVWWNDYSSNRYDGKDNNVGNSHDHDIKDGDNDDHFSDGDDENDDDCT